MRYDSIKSKSSIKEIQNSCISKNNNSQGLSEPAVPINFSSTNNTVNRKCSSCEKEEQLQRKENAVDSTSVAPPIVQDVLNSVGKSLDTETRSFMEPRFNYDFSNVKIHDNDLAAKSSSSINALAYTSSNNVVFNSGQYNPGSDSGKRLLAHELTHVVQQNIGFNCIQRFESAEHQDLGDSALGELHDFLNTRQRQEWGSQNGINSQQVISDIEADPFYSGKKIRLRNGSLLTPGEIISLMGDFYKTPEQLFNAPAQEIAGILSVIQQERYHRISSGAAAVVYNRITDGRYTRLAEENTAHFSPQNANEWRSIHERAMTIAQGSQQNESQFNEALFMDAAAGHFLTDAFAAGHLLNKGEVLARIRIYLSSHQVMAHNPLMQTYIGVTASKTDQFILKIIHDHFNQVGFEVSNARGMHWRTFGDDHLRNAEETRHIAALAVFLSRQQIVNARQRAEININAVLDLLPNTNTVETATQAAIDYIPTAATQVDRLIYGNRDASALAVGNILAPVVRANLNAIGNPAFERQVSDQIDFNTQHQLGPTVAPQFSFDLPDFLK